MNERSARESTLSGNHEQKSIPVMSPLATPSSLSPSTANPSLLDSLAVGAKTLMSSPASAPPISDPNNQAEKLSFYQQGGSSESSLSPITNSADRGGILTAGTLIPAVLISGIDSDLPGHALAQVRQPVYDSATGRQVLIPQGTKLLLNYQSQVSFGQKRVLISVSRVLLPNGQSLNLPHHSVGDVSGYSGFKDQIANHTGEMFGAAALLGVISAGLQLSQPQQQSAFGAPSAAQTAAGAVGEQLSEISTQTISKHLNVQPTLQIRPGYLFNIIVTSDVVFNNDQQ
jgi:type IV secretion system protein VirB10